MDINVAKSFSHQLFLLYELKDLLMLCLGCQR